MKKEIKIKPKLRFPEFVKEDFWSLTKLSNFENIVSGDGDWILSENITQDGEYKIVQLSSIGFGEFKEKVLKTISTETFQELNGTQIQKGDLLINRMVDSNKINSCVFPYSGKFVTSVDVCWIRNNHFFDNYFFMCLLSTDSNQTNLLRLSSGAGRVRISKKNLFDQFSFLLPSQAEQQKIASCLSSLDNLITAHKEKLDALKDHKKGLMQNLFPQEGEKVPKYRFPEFQNDSEWGIHQIESYFEVGSSKRVLQEDWTDNGVPFFRTRELVSLVKKEPFTSAIYISSNLFSQLKEKYGIPSEGDFLVSGVGTLGIIYQVKANDEFYFKDGNVLWFKKTKDINSSYFKYCFESDHIQKQIIAQTSKSTVGTYTIKNAKSTEFWYPSSIQEQQKIASCLLEVDNLIQAQETKIEELQNHKKGLMQGLFPQLEN